MDKELKFNIVTANEIWQTGKISFRFIFDSKMNYDDHAKVKNWGVILKELSGYDRLVNVFGSNSEGVIFGWGNKSMDEEWLTVLLEKLPCCSLLMEKEDAELFKKYCDILGYGYTYTHFDGYLKTA